MTTTTTRDIVELLQADHKRVEAVLTRYDTIDPSSRSVYFNELVTELVQHEVAEELVVYPRIRLDAPDGERQVEPRIQEQAEAEKELAELEKLEPASTEFDSKFKELRAAVLEHATAEETNIFPLLLQVESADVRLEMGERYEEARSKAPTRPHPNAPDTPPGNVLLGPVAALFDKARDALKRV